MSAVNKPTTTLGEWYPPLCPHRKPPQCKGQYQFYRYGDRKWHSHENDLHIKIIETSAATLFRIHVAYSCLLHNTSVELMRIELGASGKSVDSQPVINAITTSPARIDYTHREEVIDCNAEANDLISPYIHTPDVLTRIFPREIVSLIQSYFGEPLKKIFHSLYWGRHRPMIFLEVNKWPKPALPLIKEALK